MTPDEAEKYLRNRISVTQQKVTIAKAYAIDHFLPNTDSLIQNFLNVMEAPMPQQIVIHSSLDTIGQLDKVAESINWRLAMCEAIWGLISANLLIPGQFHMTGHLQALSWTTVVPSSGGRSSGWHFDDLSIGVPSKLLFPRSARDRDQQSLADPDLYLHELDIASIHKEVEESLREAVRCFRNDLYTACLAMLGKASEGAWIELGLALVDAVPKGSSFNSTKVKDTIESPFVGIAKKINEVVKLYERKDMLKDVHQRSGVRIQDLRNAVVWSDCVRESRNTVHYGVNPSMKNTYEKVAVLLIGAVTHLKILYKIFDAAK